MMFRGSFDPAAGAHSHANAYWLGVAAELAYADAAGFRAGTTGWGVTCRQILAGSTQAHVAAANDLLIVAFRGTQPSDLSDVLAFIVSGAIFIAGNAALLAHAAWDLGTLPKRTREHAGLVSIAPTWDALANASGLAMRVEF